DLAHPSVTVPMMGVGTGPPNPMGSPAALDARLRPPDTQTKTLTISNSGDSPLTFSTTVASPAFASLTPSAGTASPGGSLYVQVRFDAAMAPQLGHHATTIDIATNDPLHPVISVPASLYVLGDPLISVQSPSTLTVTSVKTYTTAGARTL